MQCTNGKEFARASTNDDECDRKNSNLAFFKPDVVGDGSDDGKSAVQWQGQK